MTHAGRLRHGLVERRERLAFSTGAPPLASATATAISEIASSGSARSRSNSAARAPLAEDRRGYDPDVDSELRFLQQIGPSARAELLAALTAPEEKRAARIGRLSSRADAQLVAELLTELEVNEPARLRFIATIREMQVP